MSLLTGIQLKFLIGAKVPEPAPSLLVNSLQQVEVTHSDKGRSGFQMSFKVGQGGLFDKFGYPLLKSPQLKQFNRVILVVIFNGRSQILMDGMITNLQLMANNQPGGSTLTVTGEDLSLMMDMEEQPDSYEQQSEEQIVKTIIKKYEEYGFVPKVTAPPNEQVPSAKARIRVKVNTDLAYLNHLASRFNYVFYVTPGPKLCENQAYWGRRIRTRNPQPALTFNMGAYTNATSINFRYNALAPETVTGEVLDIKTGEIESINVTESEVKEALARDKALRLQKHLRKVWIQNIKGLTPEKAQERAQATLDASVEKAVTATGELDTLRYGHILEAHRLVTVRGVGDTYGGLYYVQQVNHTINIDAGTYKQKFTLNRSGVGSRTRFVPI